MQKHCYGSSQYHPSVPCTFPYPCPWHSDSQMCSKRTLSLSLSGKSFQRDLLSRSLESFIFIRFAFTSIPFLSSATALEWITFSNFCPGLFFSFPIIIASVSRVYGRQTKICWMNVFYSAWAPNRRHTTGSLWTSQQNRADCAIHNWTGSVCAEEVSSDKASESRLAYTTVFLTGYQIIIEGFSSSISERSCSVIRFSFFLIESYNYAAWLKQHLCLCATAVWWMCSSLICGRRLIMSFWVSLCFFQVG